MGREFQANMILSRFLVGLRAAGHLVLIALRPKHRAYHGTRFLALTEGDSFERGFRAYAATETGRATLSQCPSTQDTLLDRTSLAILPKESLGFQYWRLMVDYGLNEEFYISEVNANDILTSDPQRNWYRVRVGMLHDLRHLLTGYKPDPMGELCLLTFRCAQVPQHGLPFLILMAFFAALGQRRTCPIGKSVLEAYHRGKAAQSLDLVNWELARERPLAWHRATLNIAPPRHYQPSLASDLYSSQFDKDIGHDVVLLRQASSLN